MVMYRKTWYKTGRLVSLLGENVCGGLQASVGAGGAAGNSQKGKDEEAKAPGNPVSLKGASHDHFPVHPPPHSHPKDNQKS